MNRGLKIELVVVQPVIYLRAGMAMPPQFIADALFRAGSNFLKLREREREKRSDHIKINSDL